jgi:outer membrane protein assembly factor BamA
MLRLNQLTFKIHLHCFALIVAATSLCCTEPLYGFSLFNENKESVPLIINSIEVKGNKHTSESIILREVFFREGDTVDFAEITDMIELSCRNILKTSLFHTATMAYETLEGKIAFTVYVTERWYWWIWPLIENPDRNFNDWWQHRDLSRLSAGLHYQHENVRGKMEKLNIKALGGYRTYLETSYEWPYINRQKSLGIGVFASYTSQHEVNYATVDNKQVFYQGKDIMFQSFVFAASLKYRPGTHLTHSLTLQYWQPRFHDSIQFLNPGYLLSNTDPQLTGITYLLKADYRDNRYYPLNGFYAETEAGYFTDIDLPYSQRSLRTSLRGYVPLVKNLYAASEFTFRFTGPLIKPYYLQNALGYNREFIRGYEYLVIEAPHYWIFKSHLKYAAVPLTTFKVPFIGSEKFNTIPLSIYAGPHFDAGKAFPELDNSTNPCRANCLWAMVQELTWYLITIKYSGLNIPSGTMDNQDSLSILWL